MSNDDSDPEGFLEVGCVAIMDPRKRGERYRTVIRGWHRGSHVLLDRPRAPNGTFILIDEGLRVGLRFMREGKACGFETLVMGWDKRQQMPYLRVTWPEKVEHVAVRRFQRVDVELRARVAMPGGESVPGTVVDLSTGGLGVISTLEPERNSVVAVDVELPDTTVRGLRCVVRAVRGKDNGAFFLGCEFEDGQRAQRDEVEFFITSSLERLRASKSGKPRLLLIDPDETSSHHLKTLYEAEELEVVYAGGIVDGFHRLRMSRPELIVVAQSLPELPGLDVCRILRKTPGLESIRLFLHGATDGLQAAAEIMGITLLPPLQDEDPEGLAPLHRMVKRVSRMAVLKAKAEAEAQ